MKSFKTSLFFVDESHFTSKSCKNLNLELTALSLSWSALQPFEIPKMLLLLSRTQNFEEFREAMTYFSAPNVQMNYADIEGNIGFQAVGLIPVKPRSSGLFPVPGWTDENEWSGFAAFEDMPGLKIL